MLSVTRSPLTSPAIRTVISASSYTSFPFHHAAPSSPLSRQTHSPSQRNLPGSPRVPRESTAQILGSPTFGSYFNLGAQAPSPSHLGSPRFLALPQIVANTPPAHSSGEKHLTVSKLPQMELTPECLTLASPKPIKNIPSTMKKSTEARTRRRPSFTLDIPRPNVVRDDSFEAVALARVAFTSGTPGELTWSGSFDSIVTLKLTKGRVATPYPKSEEGWIEDGSNAIRDNIQTRLARLCDA